MLDLRSFSSSVVCARTSIPLFSLVAAVACGDADAVGGAGGNAASTTSTKATSDTSSARTTSTASSTGAGGESPGPERAPGMTDLSILFPFPASAAQVDALLAPDDVGAAGELLPFAMFEAVPDLSFFFEDKPAHHAALRVVGARLDPCFPEPGSEPCRRQVRLVMQPIQIQGAMITSIDAAVHLFYELDEASFTGLLGDVTRAQSAADAEGPLRVHPAMARDGLDGAAAQAIRAAILARAGQARLSRITFMQLSGQANVWIFGGFEVQAGQMTPISIVGSGELTQTFTNNALPDPQDFHGDVDPVIPPDDFSVFYESDTAHGQTDDALWPAYEAALRVRHPSHHTSESVSCVGCHTADAALAWADRNTDLEMRASPLRFTSPLDLTPPSAVHAERSQAVRAFGYQDETPAVSHRTIFETAVLALEVRALYGF